MRNTPYAKVSGVPPLYAAVRIGTNAYLDFPCCGLYPLQGDLLEDFGRGRADESPGFAAGLQTHEPPGLLQGAPHQPPAQRHDKPMTTPSDIDKSPIAG